MNMTRICSNFSDMFLLCLYVLPVIVEIALFSLKLSTSSKTFSGKKAMQAAPAPSAMLVLNDYAV